MGLTRIKAEQISDIDYKQAVRAIQTTNVTLAGGAPSQVDGVNLMKNDRVLVNGQTAGSENGLYYVATLGTGSNGTWTRTSDANQTGEIEAGMIVMVTEGIIYADTQWKLITNDPIVVGTTPLTFTINLLSSVGGSNTQIQYNNAGTLAGSSNLTWDGSSVAVGGAVSATGNVTGNYILGNGSQLSGIITSVANINNGTSILEVVSSGGNIRANVGGTANVAVLASTGLYVTGLVSASGNVSAGNLTTAGQISATGNITGGNITGADVISANTLSIGNIINSNANGVGNIGNSTVYFNTVFAKATSAQYADVAEKYVADRFYPPGTVMEIGSAAEVQATTAYASTRIAGVISTNPALIMNSTQSDANAVEIALLGRVPCRVTGDINRGDLLTSSERPGVATALAAQDYRPGSVIGKALEGHRGTGEGMIEVMVGRL